MTSRKANDHSHSRPQAVSYVRHATMASPFLSRQEFFAPSLTVGFENMAAKPAGEFLSLSGVAMKVCEIGLSCGKTIMLDEDDAPSVSRHRWHFVSNYRGGYAATNIDGKKVYMHRFIARARHGELVDHINRDKLDNRRSNLRIATPSQNVHNQISCVTNSTGYRGVYRDKNSYRSQIFLKRRRVSGRRRTTAAEAARDYDAMASLHYGEFAILNFPGDHK